MVGGARLLPDCRFEEWERLFHQGKLRKGYLSALKKILIVDDSPVARMMLKSCLPKAKEFSLAEADQALYRAKTDGRNLVASQAPQG